jgi:hypothetical protein
VPGGARARAALARFRPGRRHDSLSPDGDSD